MANTLDILGDKWSLQIIRDLLITDKHRYGEFMESIQGITTNILADRLRRLEEFDLIERRVYQQNPVRHEYFLTATGRDLEPIVREMIQWGLRNIAAISGTDWRPARK